MSFENENEEILKNESKSELDKVLEFNQITLSLYKDCGGNIQGELWRNYHTYLYSKQL